MKFVIKNFQILQLYFEINFKFKQYSKYWFYNVFLGFLLDFFKFAWFSLFLNFNIYVEYLKSIKLKKHCKCLKFEFYNQKTYCETKIIFQSVRFTLCFLYKNDF